MHDVNEYYGVNKPKWSPEIENLHNKEFLFNDIKIERVGKFPIFIFNDALRPNECESLIKQFDEQESYPVGVDGYCKPDELPGSYRAMGWSEKLAESMNKKLQLMVPNMLSGHPGVMGSGYELRHFHNNICIETPFKVDSYYKFLGSTPWMRFMKYKKGGKHVPHYDAPYHNINEKYITLFSWVLYLNTPNGSGGDFEFVDDDQHHKSVKDWNLNDWTEMSGDVLLSIKPEVGKLLVFPHWLCHQVDEYVGDGYRYIIRGDVSYGY